MAEECPLRHIKYNVHTVFQTQPVDKLKEISKKLAIPVHLMLLNLDGNMNIAMSIRSAAVLGISDVWIIGKRQWDARPEVGSKNYINVHKIAAIDPLTFFADNGLTPILVEQGGTPLEEMNFKPYIGKQKVCFIMGSESHGIPADWLTIGPKITISQYGLIRSFNVSIAASIVLYEYMKQWRESSACVTS
jgi:tRNA G18 (ribose-2'-O)-methylase SpoU